MHEKKTVSPEDYIRLLNEALKRHPDYSPELEFVPYPEDASGADITGYVLKNMNKRRQIYEDVSGEIFRHYRIGT